MSDQPSEMVEEVKPAEVKRTNWARVGVIISTLGMIVFVGAFGFGYFQLSKINLSLAKTVMNLQQQNNNTQEQITGLKNSLDGLQQIAQKAQDLTNQQAQMIADWQAAQQGNLVKWYVAETQYLVKLANDQLLFVQNAAMALTLLQRAQQVLENLHDDNLLPIRQSIAADIANLQAQSVQDVSQLYVRLSALDQQFDQLPLPTNPLKENPQATVDTAKLSWWKAGMQRSWEALQKIVVVRYNGSNTLPLLLPDEKIFLYQNLHAQMASVMWAALHHQPEIYRQGLTRLSEWVQKYFMQDAPITKNMLVQLADLQKENLQTASVNLSVTLQQLDAYLTKTAQPMPSTSTR